MAGRFEPAKRVPWIFAGLVLSGLGLGMDSLGLGGSPGMGLTQIECLALGILITFVSALPFAPSHTLVWTARTLLFLTVLAASAELAAMAYSRFRGGPAAPAESPGSAALAPDPDFEFTPFVLWRIRPGYSDGTATVDGSGIRITSPPGNEGEDAFQVVLLGGWSIWGWGVPDPATLASHMQEDLDALLSGPVRVVNMAQPGWTVTQQVIALMLEMRAGSRPDLVLLSVGLHDAAAAAAGSRVDPRWLRSAMTAWNGGAGDPGTGTDVFHGSSAALALLSRALGPSGGRDPSADDAAAALLPVPAGDPDSAVRRMSDDVLGAVQIARSISGSCGTRLALVLTPCWPVSRRNPSPEERDLLLPAMDSTAGADFVRAAWQELREEAGRSSWFLDLSGSMDSVPGHLYHGPDCLTPLGNEVLASVLVDEIASRGLLW